MEFLWGFLFSVLTTLYSFTGHYLSCKAIGITIMLDVFVARASPVFDYHYKELGSNSSTLGHEFAGNTGESSCD